LLSLSPLRIGVNWALGPAAAAAAAGQLPSATQKDIRRMNEQLSVFRDVTSR